jgi:hypothetical protein
MNDLSKLGIIFLSENRKKIIILYHKYFQRKILQVIHIYFNIKIDINFNIKIF